MSPALSLNHFFYPLHASPSLFSVIILSLTPCLFFLCQVLSPPPSFTSHLHTHFFFFFEKKIFLAVSLLFPEHWPRGLCYHSAYSSGCLPGFCLCWSAALLLGLIFFFFFFLSHGLCFSSFSRTLRTTWPLLSLCPRRWPSSWLCLCWSASSLSSRSSCVFSPWSFGPAWLPWVTFSCFLAGSSVHGIR